MFSGLKCPANILFTFEKGSTGSGSSESDGNHTSNPLPYDR